MKEMEEIISGIEGSMEEMDTLLKVALNIKTPETKNAGNLKH